MEKLLILSVFVVPFIQMLLIILRYRGKIIIPIGASTLFTFLLGCSLSIWAQNIVSATHQNHPVMPTTVLFGFFITIVGVFPTGIIAWICYYFKHKPPKKLPDDGLVVSLLKHSQEYQQKRH